MGLASRRSFKASDAVSMLSFDRQLESLEEFWESEMPRTGELFATGWYSWKTSDEPTAQSSRASHSIEHTQNEDPYTRWASAESDADCKFHIPSRSIDDDDVDPYTTILFSDIRPFLVLLRTAEGKNTFRLIWLSFLGLDIPGFSDSLSSLAVDDKWSSNRFTTTSFLSSLFPTRLSPRLTTADSYAGVTVGREKEYGKAFGVVKEWGFGVLEPLEGVNLDGIGRMWESLDGDAELVRHVDLR